MAIARLSDAELLRLVLEDGETASQARQELEERHYQAVRVFAGVLSPSAGDVLAGQAWEQALQLETRDPDGAVRPRALSAVLSIADGWGRTDQRSLLAPDFTDWIGARDPHDAQEPDSDSPPPDGYVSASPTMVRAFDALPGHSQVALWHHEVEHDDGAVIERLLGDVPETVAQLIRRAQQELFNSYVQIHQDTTFDDVCLRFDRMLLAYVEDKSRNATADLNAHLRGCAHCADAAADLGCRRSEFGTRLAEALLPWGHAEYAATRHRPSADESSATWAAEARPSSAILASPDDTHEEEAGEPNWRRVLGILKEALRARPDAAATPADATTSAAASSEATPTAAVPPPTPTTPDIPRTAAVPTAATSTARAKRLALAAGLVCLCSLVIAAFAAGLWQGDDDSGTGPSRDRGASPTEPSKSPGRGSGDQADSRLNGAALEWRFDKVSEGDTPDTSGNGIDGILDGDPPARLLPDGGLRFTEGNEQSVTSDGPVIDTEESFSVSARVRVTGNDDDSDPFGEIVNQSADEHEGFSLRYDSDGNEWQVALAATGYRVTQLTSGADSAPVQGRWTHLTAVHDADEDELLFYIDGALQDRSEVLGDEVIDAESDFTVGRDFLNGGYFAYLDGAVKDVSAFERALSPSEVAVIARAATPS